MKSTSFSIQIYKFTLFLWAFTFLQFVVLPVAVSAEPPKYTSIKSEKVNLRAGPGKRYPIRWVLSRKNMPVKVIREFDNWRQIELFDGETKGWVYKNMLSPKRTAIIIGGTQKIYKKASKYSNLILKLEKNVIVELDHCKNAWCSIKVSGYKGWIEKSKLWGAEN